MGVKIFTDKPGFPRQVRFTYSLEQTEELERVFSKSRYPDAAVKEKLAQKLGIEASRIKIWFQNRRMRPKQRDYQRRNRRSKREKKINENSSTNQRKLRSSTKAPPIIDSPLVESPSPVTESLPIKSSSPVIESASKKSPHPVVDSPSIESSSLPYTHNIKSLFPQTSSHPYSKWTSPETCLYVQRCFEPPAYPYWHPAHTVAPRQYSPSYGTYQPMKKRLVTLPGSCDNVYPFRDFRDFSCCHTSCCTAYSLKNNPMISSADPFCNYAMRYDRESAQGFRKMPDAIDYSTMKENNPVSCEMYKVSSTTSSPRDVKPLSENSHKKPFPQFINSNISYPMSVSHHSPEMNDCVYKSNYENLNMSPHSDCEINSNSNTIYSCNPPESFSKSSLQTNKFEGDNFNNHQQDQSPNDWCNTSPTSAHASPTQSSDIIYQPSIPWNCQSSSTTSHISSSQWNMPSPQTPAISQKPAIDTYGPSSQPLPDTSSQQLSHWKIPSSLSSQHNTSSPESSASIECQQPNQYFSSSPQSPLATSPQLLSQRFGLSPQSSSDITPQPSSQCNSLSSQSSSTISHQQTSQCFSPSIPSSLSACSKPWNQSYISPSQSSFATNSQLSSERHDSILQSSGANHQKFNQYPNLSQHLMSSRKLQRSNDYPPINCHQLFQNLNPQQPYQNREIKPVSDCKIDQSRALRSGPDFNDFSSHIPTIQSLYQVPEAESCKYQIDTSGMSDLTTSSKFGYTNTNLSNPFEFSPIPFFNKRKFHHNSSFSNSAISSTTTLLSEDNYNQNSNTSNGTPTSSIAFINKNSLSYYEQLWKDN